MLDSLDGENGDVWAENFDGGGGGGDGGDGDSTAETRF